jgi:hypothetical protein
MTHMSQRSIQPSRTQEIVEVVNQRGLVKAAAELGIPQSTLCTFIRRQGYRRKQQYVKEAQTQQTT